jgi:hypothetical protein
MADEVAKSAKPSNTRVNLEVAQLEKAFEQLGCPKCGQSMSLKLWTVCIATSIYFECSDTDRCKYFFQSDVPSPTSIHWHNDPKDKYDRSTDYAVNVLYIVGFIGMGDGRSRKIAWTIGST